MLLKDFGFYTNLTVFCNSLIIPSFCLHISRTASDHRGVPIKISGDRPPSPGPRADHSPVIRDSSKTPTPSSTPSTSNNIKRHASFHGILPSKKEDLVRSGSTVSFKLLSYFNILKKLVLHVYLFGHTYHINLDMCVTFVNYYDLLWSNVKNLLLK